jgi:chloramphenicol 3-O phosphotransferase
MQAATPARLLPGMGLRPGAERPDLEPFVQAAFEALYAAVAALSREGVGVVVDVGHHDAYSRPLGILRRSAAQLAGLPVLFVGVRCPVETALARRRAQPAGYVVGAPSEPVPEPVLRWETEVHQPGIYDLEVDTRVLSPGECVDAIAARLAIGPGTAFAQAAAET